MIIFFVTIFLMFLIETSLVGITFFSLKERFRWSLSRRMSFFSLLIIFIILNYYYLPMVVSLGIRFTVGNPEISSLFNLKPDTPAAELFDFGAFEAIYFLVQAFVAALIGEKIFEKKEMSGVNPLT